MALLTPRVGSARIAEASQRSDANVHWLKEAGESLPVRTTTVFVLMILSLLYLLPERAVAQEGEYQQALMRAEALAERDDHTNAIKAFNKAQKLAGLATFACSYGLSRSFTKTGDFKRGIESARRALDLAQEPAEEAAAWHQLGMALYQGSSSPARLEEAVEAFSRVLELSEGKAPTARLNLGMALLKLEHDEEGVAVLQDFLATAPEGPAAEQARSFIKEPRRARVDLVPDFEVTTLQGDVFTSEDLRGKAVLIDFWGTWCAPCVASIPHLQRLHRRYQDAPFVVLSISNDRDEDVLREFIAEKEMVWHQVWDQTHQLTQRLFQIDGYPTFLVVDHEGVVIYRGSGWSEAMGREIDTLVARAIRRAKKAVP